MLNKTSKHVLLDKNVDVRPGFHRKVIMQSLFEMLKYSSLFCILFVLRNKSEKYKGHLGLGDLAHICVRIYMCIYHISTFK